MNYYSIMCECCGENPAEFFKFGAYCKTCHEACLAEAAKEEEREEAARAARARAEYLRDVARTFCRRCKSAEYETSGLSEAIYILYSPKCGRDIKIRLANHTARPTYEALHGAADIELGSHGFADPLPEEISAAVKEIRRRVARKIRARRA